MARVFSLYVGILTALALCKYCPAEQNANGTHCGHHGNGDNCTDPDSHFSECPEHMQHYCVHGDCRYVEEQQAPSCRCQPGFVGSRCEYVELDWRTEEERHIIIGCVVAALVVLILVVVMICVCSHRRYRPCRGRTRRRDGEPRNGMEKLGMMEASAQHTTLTTDSAQPAHTDA